MSGQRRVAGGGIIVTQYSRRGFLGVLGLGAAGAMIAGTGGLAGVDMAAAQSFVPDEDHFGRMFPDLPPAALPTPQTVDALMRLGRLDGLMDAGDQLSAGPENLIADPTLSANNRNNPDHTAGVTFMGQFMDHDMSFDTTSRLGKPTPPQVTVDHRTPAFD